MAGDLPLALRRTQRRRRHHDLDQPATKTPAPAASTRRSSRATGASQKKPTTTTRTAGKAARSAKKTKASVSQSASVNAADDATDDSVTLVDDADDSITALDFDIPISSNNNKRKRLSHNGEGNQQAIKKVRRQTKTNNDDSNNSSIVHILPLRRQILDDHIIRRIRRNGLSSEMNEAYAEKRSRRQKTLEELRRAREELRDRDAEIERLRELTALFGDGNSSQQHQHNHTEMELELSRLREQVLGHHRRANDLELTSSPPVARADDDDDGWGGMDGMSDAGDSDAGGDFGVHDFNDDEEFGEADLAELESGGTPAHHRRQQESTAKRPSALRLHGPTLTPPSTSPTKLASSPVRQVRSSNGSSTTSCDAGVQAAVADVSTATDAASQACIPDPAIDALHEKLGTLRAEVSSLNKTLLERDALQSRMGDKLAQLRLSGGSPSSAQAENQDFELQLDIVLQDLAEKTDRLGELSALLMPTPSGGSTVDNKEATAQLSSALQSVRETLSDLDPTVTLPRSAAPILVLAATRLRELDTTLTQRTAAHEAQLSTLSTDLAAARASEASKQTQITNLSADIAHLSETIEALHEEIDILQSTSTAQQNDLDSARDAALQQKTAAAEAESRLAEAVAKVTSLSQQLAEREAQLKGRDGEVERLRGELVAAGATIAKLRGDASREKGRSLDAVRAMRAQMLAALRVGEGFLGDEGMTKTEEVDVVVGGEAARDRSDDSGLGLGEDLQLV